MVANGLLASRPVRKIYLGESDAATSRASILDALDDGASIVRYLGHGGIQLWSGENAFNTGDVTSMRSQAQQMLLTMNGHNGYFHFPSFDSAMQLSPPRSATWRQDVFLELLSIHHLFGYRRRRCVDGIVQMWPGIVNSEDRDRVANVRLVGDHGDAFPTQYVLHFILSQAAAASNPVISVPQ